MSLLVHGGPRVISGLGRVPVREVEHGLSEEHYGAHHEDVPESYAVNLPPDGLRENCISTGDRGRLDDIRERW